MAVALEPSASGQPATRPASARQTRRPWDLATDLRFEAFAIIFALGTIHHELQFILEQQNTGPFTEYMERHARIRPTIGWPSEVGIALHLGDLLIALLILALPWRRALTSVLAVTFLLSQLVNPERFPSHNSVMAAGLVIVLIFSVAEALGGRRRPTPAAQGTDWLGWTRTGLMMVCSLTYFFASFQKWNPVYFWPKTSPVMEFIYPYTTLLGLPIRTVSNFTYPLIFVTITVELLLPLLLLIPRTRLFGCLLGLVFHLPMLGQGVGDFPTLILAFYAAFLSLEQAQAIRQRCLQPSWPRWAVVVAGSAFGWLTISQADHNAEFWTGVAADGRLLALHYLYHCVTFTLLVYLTVVVGSMLARPASRNVPEPSPA